MKTYSIADKEKMLFKFLKRFKNFTNYTKFSRNNWHISYTEFSRNDWHFYRHIPSKKIIFLSDHYVAFVNYIAFVNDPRDRKYRPVTECDEKEIDDEKDRVIGYWTNGPKLSWQEIELKLAIAGEL